MRRLNHLFPSSASALSALSAAAVCLATACGDDRGGTSVSVNFDLKPLSTVSADLIGIHTAVYDGLLTRSATTPARLRAAGVTSLRYPGGSYADLYHWETHTGTMTPAVGFGGNGVYIDRSANFGSFALMIEKMGARALMTVNYGMDRAGTGPGNPEEAAAWVAYANSLPTNDTIIGADATGYDWKTAGYWGALRASAPLPLDDGKNFLRIAHPAPLGIKYWEIGNEIYGNGYYHGSPMGAGWEADLHAPYDGANGTARRNNPALSPETYGKGVKRFSDAMKAVDPAVQIGTIVHWPYTEYSRQAGETDWNEMVLPHACAGTDFVVNHWYAGKDTVESLLTVPAEDIPAMYADLRTLLTSAAAGCGARGATMPIAVTEWGPNLFQRGVGEALGATPPAHTQLVGIFAAESYANFMEQDALSVHWAQLHDPNYLIAPDDKESFGYHGAEIAHHLAGGGDAMVPARSNHEAILTHASKHADGGVSVMLTNIGKHPFQNVKVNVEGGATRFAAKGMRHAYTPVSTDLDGDVTSEEITASGDGRSVVVAVPAHSVVVVAFPPR
ncbi:MAG: hypothetical protein ABUS79_05505 [Pseudomonadota bacterium]